MLLAGRSLCNLVFGAVAGQRVTLHIVGIFNSEVGPLEIKTPPLEIIPIVLCSLDAMGERIRRGELRKLHTFSSCGLIETGFVSQY